MMKMYFDYLRTLVNSKKGQGMVEYGLIISLIAVAAIAVLGTLGGDIAGLFENVTGTISSNSSTSS